MELGRWEEIIDENTILVGDFNAHDPKWGSAKTTNSAHIVKLIEDFNLCIANNLKYTRYGTENQRPSIIDLTLTAGVEIEHWEVIDKDDHHTESDHRVIMWETHDECQYVLDDKEMSKIKTGWGIGKMGEEENKKAEEKCKQMAEQNPYLEEDCGREEVEKEAVWLQNTISKVLNQHTEPIRLSERSKPWWNEEIKKTRMKVGWTWRHHRNGRIPYKDIKEADKNLYRPI
jgi:hypothetical protein